MRKYTIHLPHQFKTEIITGIVKSMLKTNIPHPGSKIRFIEYGKEFPDGPVQIEDIIECRAYHPQSDEGGKGIEGGILLKGGRSMYAAPRNWVHFRCCAEELIEQKRIEIGIEFIDGWAEEGREPPPKNIYSRDWGYGTFEINVAKLTKQYDRQMRYQHHFRIKLDQQSDKKAKQIHKEMVEWYPKPEYNVSISRWENKGYEIDLKEY